MITISKILVPIDFSPRCAWAARYASKLAHLFRAELLCLHVGEPGQLERLKTFVGPEVPGVRRACVILEGDAAEKIVEFSNINAVDMIVMPTHAHGRFRRFLLGSVTAKVLHDSTCPVWTGVHHADAPLSMRMELNNIVCAVECDATCVPLIQWASDLCQLAGAKLYVVHAVPAADETSDNRGEIELRRFLFERAEAEFVRLLSSAGIAMDVIVAGGPIVRVVRETALRHHADAIVIGRGHTLAGLGRLRTHAYALIRESPCPVVSI